MIMGISGHFLTERKPLGTMKTRDAELRFAANPRLVNAAGQRVEPFAGPVAILVDSMTGSASECFAGGMQAIGRARVFGQTSMGQALPAFFAKLPNGDVLIHATGDFVTADGTRLEGRGVVPDEAVAIDRAALLAGRDATLDAALKWIDRRGGRGLANSGLRLSQPSSCTGRRGSARLVQPAPRQSFQPLSTETTREKLNGAAPAASWRHSG